MSEPSPADVYRAPNSDFSAAPRERRGWSRQGAASIVLGVGSTLMLVAVIASEAAREMGGPQGVEETSNLVAALALAAMLGLLTGVGLGVGGLLQTRRTRGLAIVGLIVNLFVALSLALLIVIGVMVKE